MNLKEAYNKTIQPKLANELNLGNAWAAPRLEKITLNIGAGSHRDRDAFLKIAEQDLMLISGQKPSRRTSKKAIAGFKLRAGEVIGLQVTLRGQRMYDFLERLINVALPRIRDFRGLDPKKFDRSGNYTFGIKEHSVFPEVDQEKIHELYGISIALTTTARNVQEGRALLLSLGLPLQNQDK